MTIINLHKENNGVEEDSHTIIYKIIQLKMEVIKRRVLNLTHVIFVKGTIIQKSFVLIWNYSYQSQIQDTQSLASMMIGDHKDGSITWIQTLSTHHK